MSNPLAIAGVTATLRRKLLDAGIGFVTTLPPDQAASDAHRERVNLFLYDLLPNAAWRNREIPGQVKPGETGFPPLALNLYYLLTAYGDETPSLLDHRLLGRAMAMFHDSAILSPQDIKEATELLRDEFLDTVPDLHQQIDRVRITPHTISVEDKSRLWGTFQTQYRVSVAFEVSVVLIDSVRQPKTALPVTRRGRDDRGWETAATLGPILDRLEYRDALAPRSPAFPSAAFPKGNDPQQVLTLHGTDIPLTECELLIRDPRAVDGAGEIARIKPLEPSTRERVRFAISPAQAGAKWVSGLLTVAVGYALDTDHPKSSPALPLAIAPRLRLNAVGQVLAIPSTEGNRSLLTVSCDPPLASDDGVFLILDEAIDPARLIALNRRPIARQLPLRRESTSHTRSTPTFDATGLPPGTYRVRLRVDGIDSHVMRLQGSVLDLDDSQKLVKT